MRRASGLILILWAFPALVGAQEAGSFDRALEAFWKADSVKGREKAGAAIVNSGASFATVLDRLAEGRAYSTTETGELHWGTLPGSGPSHATTVMVPANYNPAVKYPVRVFLHGGVARPDPVEGDDAVRPEATRPNRPRRRLESKGPSIAVYPSGYADAQWWFANQMDNFREILDRLKRNYNVDENRVHLMGVSDGGTGAYFVGLKDPTPWSVFFPLNGFLRVLSNPIVRADGELFTTNLTNRPIYAVNGERDPLYPVIAVYPYMVLLKRAGADVTFRPMAGAGHDTAWWPTEASLVDAFEEEHPRNPFPTTVAWETERVDRYNRIDWLVVDRLDPTKGDAAFPDNNTLEIQDPVDFGLRVDSRRDDGRKVMEILAETTASAMGLRKGDTIIRMDQTMIRSAGDIGRAFDEHAPGTPIAFEVERKGQRLTMQGAFPPPPKPLRREAAFPHAKPGGRVEVVRKGNRFEARARGVGALRLLLSPEMIDFEKPVTVVVNGKTTFESRVERSVATLVHWAARDNDRTMLFGAEIRITTP